jgi:hypothetical protein
MIGLLVDGTMNPGPDGEFINNISSRYYRFDDIAYYMGNNGGGERDWFFRRERHVSDQEHWVVVYKFYENANEHVKRYLMTKILGGK